MALSYQRYLGDGATATFSVPFIYLSKTHVGAFVNDAAVSFSWLTGNTIRLTQAPAANALVEVRRVTPLGQRLTDFVDGSTLTENDLDTSATQFLYLAQEAYDLVQRSLALTYRDTFDARGKRIASLADPVDDTDAANKRWSERLLADRAMLLNSQGTFEGRGTRISSVADPVDATDAANKRWSENLVTTITAGLASQTTFLFVEKDPASSVTFESLAATVKAYPLDSFAAPVANVSLNGKKITSLAAGAADTDAANTGQVGTALASAKTYADTAASAQGASVLASAKTYADSKFSSAGTVKKYATTIIGDGSKLTFDVAHNLGSNDVHVYVKDASDNTVSLVDAPNKDANTVTVTFAQPAPASGKSYRVIVQG